ncbi:hypothetical protein [Sulfitobacter geojensis]|uniref:hypothetical protein n=1 Tax=Sulfitobacter geojensis TaxID=1342299 RepID=UPI0036DF40F3
MPFSPPSSWSGRGRGISVAAYPMALAAEIMGWRSALWGLQRFVSFGRVRHIGLGLSRASPTASRDQCPKCCASVRLADLPVNRVRYVFPGAVRGLWMGLIADVFNTDTTSIGQASLLMGLAMVLGWP